MADLFDVLTESGQRKLAAPEFLKKLLTKAVQHPEATGAALGATIAAVGQYATRRGQQKAFARAERHQSEKAQERKKEGRKPGMWEEVEQVTAKPMRQLADVAARHPVKSSLAVAPVGALVGSNLAKLFK